MEIQQIELGCRFQKQNQFKKGGKGKEEEKKPRTAEGGAARQECVCVSRSRVTALCSVCGTAHEFHILHFLILVWFGRKTGTPFAALGLERGDVCVWDTCC